MLDHLKKYFSSKEGNPVASATQQEKETVEMANTNLPDVSGELSEMAATVATLEANLAELQGSFAELNTKYTEAIAKLADAEAAKASLLAASATAKLAARKEKLEFAVGTEKADALLSALEGVDDAAFESVVSSLTMNLDAESKSKMFAENGVTAEANAEKVVESGSLKAKLEEKYKS